MTAPDPRPPTGQHPSSRSSGQTYFVLGLALGLLLALVIERGTRLYFDRDMEMVRAVRDLALEDFVGPVRSDTLVDDALRGMLSGLDAYSHYYGPAELAELDRETSGEFLGIGVVFRSEEPGRILFPYPGSPAEKAGLRVGDRILSAEGEPVDSMAALQALLHRESAAIDLGVEGLDGATRDVVLRPDIVLDPTVRHARMLDPELGLGYVAIRAFSRNTSTEFEQAITALQDQGLRALVLDLRANPGGILNAAVSIANRFIPAGALVATRERDETRVTEADAELATLASLPLVVLLDELSASASEVLAAALQDHAAAVLVGAPSYGKGTVQTLKRIGEERAVVKITTAHYCSPSLRRIEHTQGDAARSGIAPDLWVQLSSAEEYEVHRHLASYAPPDGMLAALHEWEEREGVELIERPPLDRQLDAAVALLSGRSPELRADALH